MATISYLPGPHGGERPLSPGESHDDSYGMITAVSKRNYEGGLFVRGDGLYGLERANPEDALTEAERRLRVAARSGVLDEAAIKEEREAKSLLDILEEGDDRLARLLPERQDLHAALRAMVVAVDEERLRRRLETVEHINRSLEFLPYPYWVLTRTQVSLNLENRRVDLPLEHDLAPLRRIDVGEDGKLISYYGLPGGEEVMRTGRVDLYVGDIEDPEDEERVVAFYP